MELRLENISKSFPAVKALDKVSITIKPGEIHAICGENGAGKSTLLNIITGNLQSDEGSMLIDGNVVSFSSPQDAFRLGIAIVYQHLSLVPSLSIAENIYASNPLVNKYGFLKRSAMQNQANALLQKLNLHQLEAGQLVSTLNAGERQMVEIAKALSNNPGIVFFDEPTASISEKDVQVLFNMIRQLKKEGVGIVYISHRLHEIFQLADVITVLKDGKSQGTYHAAEVDSDQLIQLMVGREIARLTKNNLHQADVLLEVDNLCGKGFRDISFNLHKGEIVGMAGLIGAGRTEIAKAIFGSNQVTGGTIRIKNKKVSTFHHPADAMKYAIGYVPEDRKTEGIFPDKSVAENIYVTQLAAVSDFNPKKLLQTAAGYCSTLNIKTPSVYKKAGELSGGNQQKLILARWLQTRPDILILDEPTHGIDVGAKFEIYQLIQQMAAEGKAILLISSELSELLHLCNRILVIKEGRCVANLNAAKTTEEEILSLAMKTEITE